MVTIRQKVFEADHVTKVVKDALENPKYKPNVLKMKMQSEATGGRDLLVKSIVNYYIAGGDHLVDKELTRKYYTMSACWGCMTTLFILGVLGALIAFTVLYFL